MNLEEHVINRNWLAEKVRAEVVGPDPSGDAVITPGITRLPDCTWADFRTPKKQLNGEEILWQDSPLKRYGAGILYPAGSRLTEIEGENLSDEQSSIDDDSNLNIPANLFDESILAREITSADDSEDYDVSLANALSPSAIGLSFLADLSILDGSITIELVNVSRASSGVISSTASAVYKRSLVTVKDDKNKCTEKTVWLRNPIIADDGAYPKVTVEASDIRDKNELPIRRLVPGINGLEVVVVVRRWKNNDASYSKYRLLTISFVNRKNRTGNSDDESSIFQAGIRVSSASETAWIVPYPESENNLSEASQDILSDISVNNILYRHHQTYAIGHGCAADWVNPDNGAVTTIWSDVLPVYETPSTTAELEFTNENGQIDKLTVSMRKLAGLDPQDAGWKEVYKLLAEYELWINNLRVNELAKLDSHQVDTAEALVKRCESCLKRIRDGISLLQADGPEGHFARRAFELANHAMLLAQLRGGAEIRVPDTSSGSPKWVEPAKFHDPSKHHDFKGYWRPFQIAFLLMSLRGICDPKHNDRDIVDLIWFPTGGGKTEAYLGVTAFTIFYNRLIGRESTGCDVLMRYTLRLLTAQQFQRAATLFCAMERLRVSNEKELGDNSFTLGLWVGSKTTPNSRKDALDKLKALEKNSNEENPFVVLQCPWCGAMMGPLDLTNVDKSNIKLSYESSSKHKVLGYVRSGTGSNQTVVYQCPDSACEFSAKSSLNIGKPPLLPIATIDEDLISKPPSLLIGTVDKFAMLAWKPDLRSFFGISEDGRHKSSPPSLIIQDELHLISGPLGTMVGAYETVIDRLCRKNGVGTIGPKIVASTATISRAQEQIKHLYARKQSMLFPPSGLSASDSFFAREAQGPGRMYMGVMAPAHFSLQTTEARVFATLLQSVPHMPTGDNGKDPWWSLLCFFNSLRELGSASTLLVADVREYMRVIMDRYGWPYKTMRNSIVSELTSRIRSDEIPKELAKLEIPLSTNDDVGQNRPVDVCLASNVIEVGVDLPRLSLMTIVGQPKSTSQYIQVSSRVGRGKDKPGLVVVLYGQSKPRDRSHYEHFRGYHQKLYAQVEPTSVTPFSAPAIERALHGVVVSLVRQLSSLKNGAELPRPYPLTNSTLLGNALETILKERSDIVTDGESTEEVIKLLHKRLNEWQSWDPSQYGGFGKFTEAAPLMYPAGASAPMDWNGLSWPTLSSMRDVDASGEAVITDWFNLVSSVEQTE